jgi:nucleotide-binding universal stress UspA family protein
MIKDIVTNLSVGGARDVASEFAISVARAFDAHLSAVAFAYQPPISATGFDNISPAIIDRWRHDRKAEADRARQAFDDLARQAGIAADSRVIPELIANSTNVFSAIARNYDLSVVAQAQRDDDFPDDSMIEAALFDSGRPVFVVPYIQTSGIKFDRALVCWDGSRNAARAIGDAMPFLKRVGQVQVITVEHKERRDELRGAQISEHLARHKLNVELKPVVSRDTDVANVVLSHAADYNIDFIVMGAYGHSRLREFVLGGATRGILNAMTVPVLMSH